jgi:DNA-binding NarL/FixJ family response regulator
VTGAFTGAGAPADSSRTLVGRAGETASIDQLLADARSGRGSALVVRGAAGIGKSALLAYARSVAEGFLVLHADGIESEAELPFAGLHQLLHPLIAGIDALPAPQSAALRAAFALSDETVAEPFRIALGVLGLLAGAAEQRPVLCVVDDAQWLDEASSTALRFVARRLEAEPLAVLFAARDDDAAPFAAPTVPDLRPAELSEAEARTLTAARMGPSAASGAIEWVLANANGNPLALVELPQTLTADQISGRLPLSESLPPATSVERSFLNRVRRLPAGVQQMLVLAASEPTGDRATIARAAGTLGFSTADLALAETDGLVTVEVDRVHFRHPLMRSAVYRAATFGDRERAHSALAQALEGVGDGDRRAWHRAAATSGPDDDVADELEATAERARLRGGFAGAASAWERAARLSTARQECSRRLVAAARAAWSAGLADRATSLLDESSPGGADWRLRAEVDHLRGQIEARSGSVLAAGSILLAGAAAVAPHDPDKALSMLLDAGMAAARTGDLACMGDVAALADTLPERSDGRRAVLRDLLAGAGNLMVGRSATEVPRIREAIAQGAQSEDPTVLEWVAAGAATIGDEAAEVAALNRARSLARSIGAVDKLVNVLETIVGAAFVAGRYYSVAAEATEGLRLAREIGLRNPALYHLAVLSMIAGLNGDDETCRAYAAEVADTAADSAMSNANTVAQYGLSLLDLARGNPQATITRLVALRDAPLGETHPLGHLLSAPDLVEACLQVGRREQAEEAFAVLRAFADQSAPTWALALAARCRALLAEGSEAEQAYADALSLLTHLNRRLDRARTQLLYGSFLRRQRRRGEAREQLRAAVETFDRLGAEPWAERARVELRATGETARRRNPSTITQLTPQELQIARLVGAGNSNKDVATQLFLSPRTVEYHLAKVFTKLGISSRADLIRQSAVLEPVG